MGYMKDSNGRRLDSFPIADAGDVIPIPATGMDFVDGAAHPAHPLTRRVTHTVGASGTTTATTALDVCQRTVLVLPLATSRWRLRVANRNLLSNTALTRPATVTGVAIGTPVISTSALGRRWTGDGTSALSSVLGSFAVPTNGTDYVSPWVTTDAHQFKPSKNVLLSMGITTPNSGTGISSDTALQTSVVTTAGSDNVADAAITGLTSFAAPGGFGSIWYLDVRVEYEFIGTNAIGLYLGDSHHGRLQQR